MLVSASHIATQVEAAGDFLRLEDGQTRGGFFALKFLFLVATRFKLQQTFFNNRVARIDAQSRTEFQCGRLEVSVEGQAFGVFHVGANQLGTQGRGLAHDSDIKRGVARRFFVRPQVLLPRPRPLRLWPLARRASLPALGRASQRRMDPARDLPPDEPVCAGNCPHRSSPESKSERAGRIVTASILMVRRNTLFYREAG